METKLTIGILVDADEILLWQNRILEKILTEDFAEICLIRTIGKASVIEAPEYSPLFYTLHEKIDSLFFRNKFDYDRKVLVSKLSDRIRKIKISDIKVPEEESSHGEKPVKNFHFDVILDFSIDHSAEGLAVSAKYGIWTYCIGTDISGRGFSNGYWESVKNLPEIEGSLQLLRREGGGKEILARTSRSIYPNSINVNRNNIYELAPLVVTRALKGVRLSGENYLSKQISRNGKEIEFFNSDQPGIPSSLKALSNMCKVFLNFMFRKIFYLKSARWSLLFNINYKHYPFPVDFHDYTELKAPPDKFWADPFVVKEKGFYYIFIEEFIYKTNKGHISVLKLDETGRLLSNEKIIEQPYHMSYPFIFKVGDKYFMVPETKENRTIEIYSCSSFPDKWERIGNLMDQVAATDSTLFFHNNKWWLFTSISENDRLVNYYNDLFLFYSDDLFSGKWQSHPGNPVVTDIKNSRPAGRIFLHNDKIYRPSQDCSGNYGRAFNINRITTLNETGFEEILVKRITPDLLRNAVGTHTFNFSDGLAVMDFDTMHKRMNFKIL